MSANASRLAFRFVLMIGIVSFFADLTYEGAGSVLGPYLAMLGATGAVVGIVSGFGEFLGYGLRLVSGRAADRTGLFWPITISGYMLQMASVPLLAFTHTWPQAAILIVLERVGKATRNPPRDAMLAHAGQKVGGYGWVFGVQEAVDQLGALVGPLLVAGVMVWRQSYPLAFGVLVIPAVLTLLSVAVARFTYPHPEELESRDSGPVVARRLPKAAWIYNAGACLASAGFADFPLISFHLAKADVAGGTWIAIFYAVAMAVSGSGSLVFGRLFDRYGFVVLIWLTLVATAFAPLVFLGGFWVALAGAAVWGLGMGVHESIIPAAVSPWIPADRRASMFGLFTALYGAAWFVGSALMGVLYDWSIAATIAFCVACQLAAIPFFVVVGRPRCRARRAIRP
jgi:MFS family permease